VPVGLLDGDDVDPEVASDADPDQTP